MAAYVIGEAEGIEEYVAVRMYSEFRIGKVSIRGWGGVGAEGRTSCGELLASKCSIESEMSSRERQGKVNSV